MSGEPFFRGFAFLRGVRLSSRYHVVARFLGRRVPMGYRTTCVPMGYRTTCFDRDAGFAEIRGETPTLVAIDRIKVRATYGGSEMYWRADFTMRALLHLAEPTMKPLFERLGRTTMDGLRAKLG